MNQGTAFCSLVNINKEPSFLRKVLLLKRLIFSHRYLRVDLLHKIKNDRNSDK